MTTLLLSQNADYLIIGGGTASLMVANRLSENSETQVVVLESGPDRTTDARVQDPNARPTLRGSELDWQLKIVPQTGLSNREQDQPAGKTPFPAGINAWAELGNPIGPIEVTYPSLREKKNSPVIETWDVALKGQRYDFASHISGGEKTTPISGLRSITDSQYARPTRSNLHIYTETTVRKINGEIVNVNVKEVVILAAGAFHSPKLLERSRVGQKDRLNRLGIPVNHLMGVLPAPLKVEGIATCIKALAFTRLDEKEQVFSSSHKTETSERVIKSILRGRDEASASLLLSVIPGGIALLGVILSFPLFRGSTQIASSDPNAKPIIDTQFFANDMEILWDMEVTKEMVYESAALTTHRICGTVAMLPQQAGGVADEDLRVYGTKNLRAVDASAIPLTHANLMTTVYAVAEQAADVIQSS
ncbi:hypothetical protein BDV38DRAFT_269438 [Aspergillus pseudotamarii]|uniref:Glucose-methanol-choline oxidoreductase C-terminal domain-containing protein n=1 Tax=Aspergillus pseudotamarii TaxID=132259 RepID=A0A5N6SZC3_ASPPS|nr:uncharacterized protein BDV38DRAFT_269438 [Aspergillus pseudotamarii]KAE8140038.1 hypothetical protein BDV38DRAFT_269438 [Aspergillus pseudotamarii]